MSLADDLRLYQYLSKSRLVSSLDGALALEHPYGVLVSLGKRPLGLWSLRGDHYVFRHLSNYEPSVALTDMDGVHRQTVDLLERCRNGWAEQFMPFFKAS